VTPQEHYAEAERLLTESRNLWEEDVRPVIENAELEVDATHVVIAMTHVMVVTAQVHATLATVKHAQPAE
jgi:hypothetical protein